MTAPAVRTEESDAIVVGGNLAGLVIAYLLSSWGYHTRVVEPAPHVGGIDRSFRNRNGRIFDFGLHVLDYMRSEFTTRLFQRVIGHEANLIERRRAIVLRNHLIPYNADPREWPTELRALLPSEDLIDELGTERPSRENLGRYYGAPFTDLVFDEALPSYPSEHRHTGFGVEEWELMANVYPWFFPRARRGQLQINESRKYQDRVREERKEFMLYPAHGGFGTFAAGFHAGLLDLGAEVITGARDLQICFDPEQRYVARLETGGRALHAPRVYWCAPPASLCELLSLPVPNLTPDTFALGSFEFDRPIRSDFSEIILGDPQHLINRISFPGRLGKVEDNLVQLEFAWPTASSAHPPTQAYWLENWVQSLERLGIVGAAHKLAEFDVRIFPIFYNVYGSEGQRLPELDFSEEIPPDSNLKPVLPTYRKVNINTRVPRYLEFLTRDLLGRA